MVKSISSIGKPPNMSRIAPPVKNTFRLAFVAAAWISETARLWSALRWLSSINM